MDFVNHTPFPALAFAGIDPHGQSFHVVVLRQTLTWDATGALTFTDVQAPLCEVDEYVGACNTSAVRQESDLCHYKPHCDLLVVADAYAPEGTPTPRWLVRIALRQPGAPSAALIHKTLCVTGARRFVRRVAPLRWAARLLGWLTFGQVRPSPWRLEEPQPALRVSVRDDLAFGGDCRIDAGDPAAARVAARDRLTPEQRAAHPDAALPPPRQPVAHAAWEVNPIGRGFATPWYLKATGVNSVPAPQIEDPECPITARHFADLLDGRLAAAEAARLSVGLGVRAKGHPERRRLAGTLDAAFAASPAWLPADFDFAVWNAAPPDQQCGFLNGDEVIELVNLCQPQTPGATCDRQGHTWLRLTLPGNLPFILTRFESGTLGEVATNLDTLLIDVEARQVTCVWRATLGSAPPVRRLEARLLRPAQLAALRADAAASGFPPDGR